MKNLKNVILNLSTIVIGALMLIFLSQPHFLLDGVVASYTSSGYDLLNFDGQSIDVFIAVSILMVIIFVCILMLNSIIGLLENFGVIKNKKVLKINRYIACISSVLVLLFAMFTIGGIGYRASTATKFNIAGIEFDVGELAPLSAGWAAILNFILAIALLAVVLLNKTKNVKTKSKRK